MSSFPIVDVQSGRVDGGTVATKTFSLPSSNPGDLILFVQRSGLATFPAGWTLLGAGNSGTTGASDWHGRVADGTEGASISVTLSGTSRMVGYFFVISNWYGELSGGVEVGFNITHENAPPLLTPSWGADNNLWITAFTSRRSDWVSNGAPTNYTNHAWSRVGISTLTAYMGVAVGRRELNAASEQPGAFTISGTTANIITSTLAVRGPVEVSAEGFLLRHNPRTNKVIPVLSSPTVTDIGAACVRPRVTKGF